MSGVLTSKRRMDRILDICTYRFEEIQAEDAR